MLHAKSALSDACADTVGTRIPTSDDEYAPPFGTDAVSFGDVLAVEQAVLLSELVKGKIDAGSLASGKGEVACHRSAGTAHAGVESFGHMRGVHLTPHLKTYARRLHHPDAAVDDTLVELEVRNAVAQEAAGAWLTVEDNDLVPPCVEATGHRKTCRPRPDDGHTTARTTWT